MLDADEPTAEQSDAGWVGGPIQIVLDEPQQSHEPCLELVPVEHALVPVPEEHPEQQLVAREAAADSKGGRKRKQWQPFGTERLEAPTRLRAAAKDWLAQKK